MRVVRCVNGDFFDADTYDVCPHCQGAAADSSSGVKKSNNEEKMQTQKKGLFGRKKEAPVSSKDKKQDVTMVFSQPRWEGLEESEGRSIPVEPKNNVVPTQSLWESNAEETNDVAPVAQQQVRTTEVQSANIQSTSIPSTSVPAASSVSKNAEEDIAGNSLSREIQSITASSEGKTVSFFNATMNAMNNANNTNTANNTASQSAVNAPAETSNAPAAIKQNVSTEPTTGWLVCIGGPHFGQCFCLEMGKNSIGRESTNKLVINKDMSVSRDKHAILVYEPKHRQFFLQPGDSSGLTYLNDEYITQSQILKAKDVIEIGNSKFIFIPLCGEDFCWEDYLK